MWQWHMDVWACLDWLFTSLLFLLVVALVRVHSIVRRKREIMGDLPEYPGCLPVIGHAHLATKFTYPEFIDEMVKTGKRNQGSLVFWLGPKVCAYVANPGDIENVLNRKDALNKGELFKFFQAHSNGLLNTTTPKWYRSRKLAGVPLAHKKMIESFINVYQQQSQILLDIFAKKEGCACFDVYPYLSRCCQDITYESHFGVKLEVQSNTQLSAHNSVAQAIALVLERMMKIWLFPDLIYFRTKRGKAMQGYKKHNQRIARKILATRRSILEENASLNTEGCFGKEFPKLLDVYIDEKSGLTDEDIVHEIMDIQLAGFETMSLTQSWVLLLLAMHPEHQNSVHDELDRKLGDDRERPLDLATLAECRLLDRVAKEALRLYGLPVVIRQLASDVRIENYTLPAYCEVMVGMNLVHRDPRFWEHPDRFHPDHFLPEQEAARPKYAFIPFGGGPRKCPEIINEMVRTSKENKGSLVVWLGPMAVAYVTNPSDIKTILNRRDALNKGELFNLFQAHSNGLLNTTTPNWYRSRKLAIIPVGHQKMITSFFNVYQQQSQILMDIISIKDASDHFDVYPYLSRCCQDITYESHFGVKLEIQNNPQLSAHISVAKTIDLVLERATKVWLLPDVIYFRTIRGKQMQEYINHNRNIANKIIAERRKILEENTCCNSENSFNKNFPKLLDVYLDKKNGLTDEDVVHEIMDIMLAGFETMSLTQSWVLLLLAMHPEHQNSVHEELDRVLGGHDGWPLDLSALAECRFLDRCTKEALRLFGLPIIIRQLTSDVQIENYTLPAYTEVGVGMTVVHRDPRFWQHPDKFHPDHFLSEQEATRPKYAFLPFGGGPRKCPAYAYAYVVVKFVVASLLKKYRFTTSQTLDNLPLDLFFMYKPTDGFLLKLEPR